MDMTSPGNTASEVGVKAFLRYGRSVKVVDWVRADVSGTNEFFICIEDILPGPCVRKMPHNGTNGCR